MMIENKKGIMKDQGGRETKQNNTHTHTNMINTFNFPYIYLILNTSNNAYYMSYLPNYNRNNKLSIMVNFKTSMLVSFSNSEFKLNFKVLMYGVILFCTCSFWTAIIFLPFCCQSLLT